MLGASRGRGLNLNLVPGHRLWHGHAWKEFILVGQAPGPTGPPPGRPLVGGRTGTKLMDLTGCTLKEYLWRFETTNVLDYYPGKSGKKGDRFPMVEARLNAREKAALWTGKTVVFVGMAVAEAFGAIAPKAFEWRMYWPGFRGAPIPHVSGIVDFWNDPANVADGRLFFDRLLGRVPA